MQPSAVVEELAACDAVGFLSLREDPGFELVVRVEAADPNREFEIRWPSYISYAVRSEHYCQWDSEETWTGKHVFRFYTKSKFLDFVASATFAVGDFRGPFKHFQVQSLYQIIDIASCDEPSVTVSVRA